MNRLNDEQRQALTALRTGSVAVLAGPGSGKTRTLVAAVQSLLPMHGDMRSLCLTFTIKAAENIRDQIGIQDNLFVGTFHALAAHILTTEDEAMRIASDQDLLQLFIELKRSRLFLDANVRELSLMISRYKNGSLDSARAKQLVKAYNAELSRRGLIDYDDLILRCLDKAGSLAPYRYIFVDEFQDTSPRQYELLQAVSATRTKLFVIGDPQQSIYRFRGADGSVFRRIKTDINPQVIRLQHNYRSAEMIVKAANKVFPDQVPQKPKRQDPGLVRIIETLDEYSEAGYVLRTIEHALGGTEWHRTHHDKQWLVAETFRDFAVLYRTRRQGELLAKKLRAAGLPVQCLGEDSPYASPPVQCIKAALDHVLDSNETTQENMESAARRAQCSLDQLSLETLDLSATPDSLIRMLAGDLGLTAEDGVLQFENAATRFIDLKTFLSHIDNITSQAFFDPLADAVCLSTIHSSKGLEFRHVFVTGCNEGILPSIRAAGQAELAEEQRLFYVAITRARDSLILLRGRRHGRHTVQPSSFLAALQLQDEIDETIAATEHQRQRSRQKRAQQRLL